MKITIVQICFVYYLQNRAFFFFSRGTYINLHGGEIYRRLVLKKRSVLDVREHFLGSGDDKIARQRGYKDAKR